MVTGDTPSSNMAASSFKPSEAALQIVPRMITIILLLFTVARCKETQKQEYCSEILLYKLVNDCTELKNKNDRALRLNL